MRNLCLIVLCFVLAALCGACHRSSMDDSENAALALYCKYAENECLTVAYVGDLMVQDHAVNAVMIQANDDKDWEWLQEAFDVQKRCLPQSGDSILEQQYSVDMGLQWETPLSMDEDILQKEHLDNEEIDYIAQAIVDQLGITLNTMLASETEVQQAYIVIDDNVGLMDDLRLDMEFCDETAVDRIMAAVAEKLNANGLAYNDTAFHAETVLADHEDGLMQDAKSHGQSGYVTAVDESNCTLWIFFYSDAEECSCIMTHIRKDIFAEIHQEDK